MCVPISFDFVPSILILTTNAPTFEYHSFAVAVLINGTPEHKGEVSSYKYTLTVNWNGKSVDYYGVASAKTNSSNISVPDSRAAQFNTSGETYRYVAIG